MSNRRVGREGAAKHLLCVFLLAAGFGLFARPAAAGTITVAWDLMDAANVSGYRVYVGTSPGTYSQTFDVSADNDFFIFRNAFMGVRYYFAVAARFDDSTLSPRSGEVSSVGTRTVAGSLPDGTRVPDPVLASDCGIDCFVVTEVARNLGEISSLAVANDGTVFAVEDGRRVLVLHAGASLTAFEAEPGTTLRDVALDPQFDTTGRVFLSLLRPRDRSTSDVEVLRLRYLANALGEPATIVGGMAAPLDAQAPVAVGDDGLVYVALPALNTRHPYSASVLAFDQDGRLPAGQRSPVAAPGVDQPVDMAWDATNRSLWLAGQTTGSDGPLVSVSRVAGSAMTLSNVVGAGEAPAALTVVSGAARRLLVAAGPDLIEAAPGSTDSLRIPLEAYGTPVAVAAGGGARYVAVENEGPATSSRIVKVESGRSGAAR